MTFVRGLPQTLGLTSAAVGALLIGASSLSCARADGLPNPLAGFMQPDNNNGPIDYRPRPTLVVPPNSDLPPPQSSSSTRGANWPKDPDQNAMRAAKADSRQPAPSTEREIPGDTNQKVFVRDDGPDCEPFLGMQIMCFKAPWGGDVQLPGATHSKDPKGVVVTSQPRKYLIDPPAQYLAAVQAQPGADDGVNNAIPPHKPCAMPGWFGCPEQSYAPNPNSQAGVATNAQAPQPEQQCMFPGHFGCPALPAKPQPSQAAAGPPAPGQQASQPAQPKCAMPGWFGCPEQ